MDREYAGEHSTEFGMEYVGEQDAEYGAGHAGEQNAEYGVKYVGVHNPKHAVEHNAAIVLAAGRGSRMKSSVQKQYLMMGDRPVLYYSLKQFEDCPQVDEIILVTGETEIPYCREQIVERFGLKKVSRIVSGGKERYHSVYHGLCALEHCSYVLIHDGARPFVDQPMLERALTAVRENGACVVGMPVKDTIKVCDEQQFAVETPRRSALWMVQTPQVFSFPLIKEAYRKLIESGRSDVTDDAMVLEQMDGHPVKLVEGSYQNIKITTPEDLLAAQAFLKG